MTDDFENELPPDPESEDAAEPALVPAAGNAAAPPQSEPSELAVLRAWMTVPSFAKAWQPTPEVFAVPVNRTLATAMAKLDPETRDDALLLGELERTGKAAAGKTALFRMRNQALTCPDPWVHVAKLLELAALRTLMVSLEDAAIEARATSDLSVVVGLVHEALRSASAETGMKLRSVAEMFEAVARRVLDKAVGKRCPTGVPSFDKHSGGLRAPHVAVMGASTNWGKSSWAVMVADETMKAGMRPLLISWEDDEELYGRRLLARRARVHATRLRDMNVNPDEESRILGAATAAERFDFFLDARGRSVERVSSDIRSLCASEPIDLVICDYLQAVPTSRRTQDRRNEITYVGRSLTDAIKGSNKAGLLFSQIRRLKQGERPTKHDLKESGDVENAAEIVILGYHDKDATPIMFADKAKDGMKNIDYRLSWDPVSCCFLGELDCEHGEDR